MYISHLKIKIKKSLTAGHELRLPQRPRPRPHHPRDPHVALRRDLQRAKKFRAEEILAGRGLRQVGEVGEGTEDVLFAHIAAVVGLDTPEGDDDLFSKMLNMA
jgi:hypothetical protein